MPFTVEDEFSSEVGQSDIENIRTHGFKSLSTEFKGPDALKQISSEEVNKRMAQPPQSSFQPELSHKAHGKLHQSHGMIRTRPHVEKV